MPYNYERVFTNPYPSGWENLPSIKTPIIAQALQQHTNAIVSIENYLSYNSIPSKVSDLINDAIPTKVSELENDLGFVKASQVPRKLSQLQNDTGFIVKEQIPENLSEFINNVGFITNAVNNLLNYYLKSETYSKAEMDTILSRLGLFKIEVVDQLPIDNISETTIYCVPKATDNMDLGDTFILNLDDDRVDDIGPYIDVGTPVTSEIEVGGLPNA